MTSPPRALLAMPRGPARAAVAGVLRRQGLVVAGTADPYEAAARVAEAAPDVVVVSAAGWRRRDVRFLSAVRAHAPAAYMVALVPVEKRSLAASALEAGADAWLPEPVDLRELAALVRQGRSRLGAGGGAPAGPSASRLAAEVAHAVRNPLQVAGLLLETAPDAEGRRLSRSVGVEIDRIRRAVDVVAAYGGLSAPAPAPTDLAPLLASRIAALSDQGVVTREGPDPTGPVLASADASQVGLALDAAMRFLAARGEPGPASVRGVVRRVTEEGGGLAEAAVRVRGAHLTAAEVEEAVGTVLWTDDRTRVTHPGLALPEAVARAHRGGLVARDTAAGTAVALRLPVA